MHSRGLYYYDMRAKETVFTQYTSEECENMKEQSKGSVKGQKQQCNGQDSDTHITTVEENKKYYTNRQLAAAEQAHQL